MLQSMREMAHSWVFKGLMLLLIISFGIWGVGDMFRGNMLHRTVATAGKIDISVNDLNHAFQTTLKNARETIGQELTVAQAKQIGLLDTALTYLIDESTLDQELNKLHLRLGEDAVIERLMTQPEYRDTDGKFNVARLRQLLETLHISEKQFVNYTSRDLSRRVLIEPMSIAPNPPVEMVNALYRARGQKRIFEVITIKNNAFKVTPPKDESILRAYYEAHPAFFTAPEYRQVTIAKLSALDVEKDMPVSDDTLKAEYEKRIDSFSEAERRQVVQVIAKDEETAKKIAAEAQSSHDLDAAARKFGLKSNDIGLTDANGLPPELSEPVFALAINGITAPTKTSFGWHVVTIKKIAPPRTLPFDEVKEALRDSYRHDQMLEATIRTVNKMDDELAAGHSLEDIADSLRLRLTKIPAIDANGMTPENKRPDDGPLSEDLLKAAFGQGAGESSPVIDDHTGNYRVIRTDIIKPSGLKPYNDIKEEVARRWIVDEQARLALESANKIAKDLRTGVPSSTFANMAGVEIRQSKPISKLGDTDPSISAQILPKLFGLKKGDPMVSSQSDRQIVISLTSVTDPNINSPSPEKIGVANSLKSSIQQELQNEYSMYLRKVFNVKIRNNVLDDIRQQGN